MKCFNWRLNVSTVWQSMTSLGRPFQSLEPAARNVRSPIVARCTLGTPSRCVRSDRSRCLLGMSATWIRSSTRYCRANLCNDLKINIGSLNCMRSDAHSQWRLSMMWPERRRPATDQAAALSTDWRWRHVHCTCKIDTLCVCVFQWTVKQTQEELGL